jgi:hypothetical protein
MPTFSWLATIQIVLQVCFTKRHSGRTTINDAPNSRAVAFTETGYSKKFSERVS